MNVDDGSGSFFAFVAIAVMIGLVPAFIARSKGRDNFVLWWVYGALLFIVAIIHALLLPPQGQERMAAITRRGTSDAEELRSYAALRDDGIITEDEFQSKKRELLRPIS